MGSPYFYRSGCRLHLHPLLKIWTCPSIVRPKSGKKTKISIFYFLSGSFSLWLIITHVELNINFVSLFVDHFRSEVCPTWGEGCGVNYPTQVPSWISRPQGSGQCTCWAHTQTRERDPHEVDSSIIDGWALTALQILLKMNKYVSIHDKLFMNLIVYCVVY